MLAYKYRGGYSDVDLAIDNQLHNINSLRIIHQ